MPGRRLLRPAGGWGILPGSVWPWPRRRRAAGHETMGDTRTMAAGTGREGDIQRDEGFVDVSGGRVWYERMGREGAPSLLLLHGGPGGNSEDLRPLLELGARDFLLFG